MIRHLARLGALALAAALAFPASPAAADDEARPDRDTYAAALEAAYKDNLASLGATEKELRKFGDCIVEATYTGMSAEATSAIADDNYDYQLTDDDANLFFEATNSCLEDAGIADLMVEDSATQNAKGTTSPDGTDAASGADDETAEAGESAQSGSESGDAANSAVADRTDAASGADDETAQTQSEAGSPSALTRMPIAIGLFVAAILLAAGGLVLVNRPRMAASRAARTKATDTDLDGLLE